MFTKIFVLIASVVFINQSSASNHTDVLKDAVKQGSLERIHHLLDAGLDVKDINIVFSDAACYGHQDTNLPERPYTTVMSASLSPQG